jgi:hypothetical protein
MPFDHRGPEKRHEDAEDLKRRGFPLFHLEIGCSVMDVGCSSPPAFLLGLYGQKSPPLLISQIDLKSAIP